MGKIYQGQTDLTIELTTGKDITGATSTKIGYKTPKGTIGEFEANIKNAATGVIEFNVTNETQISETGTWAVWAKITDAQGLLSIGEADNFIVYQQGT